MNRSRGAEPPDDPMTNPNLRFATLDWNRGLVFTGGAPGGPAITVDGDSVAGPSPVVLLLVAAAACSGADVVSILEKMRVKLAACRVEVTGTRREADPRRFLAMHLVFRLAGEGLDAARAERAIALSLEKYCSVVHTLAPDVALTHELILA